jgi:hypothetical protein
MKKNIQFNKKALALNKETIAKLNEEQLKSLSGGKYENQKKGEELIDSISCWFSSCKTNHIPPTQTQTA